MRRLRYFLAVAEEGHITRAAARLGMQQPPLTAQIHKLEQEVGARLLLRTSKGVTLTPAGEALARDGRAVIQAAAAAMQRARDVALGQAGRLTLGLTTSAVLHASLPAILRAFREGHPGVETDVHEDGAAGLIQALFRRTIDAAVIRMPVARPPGLMFLELLREPMHLVLPLGHRLLHGPADRAVPVEALRSERLILVRQPGAAGLYQTLVLTCRAAGFEPAIGSEVGHMLTAINLVAAGAGVTIVPESMADVGHRLVGYRPLGAHPPLMAPLTLAYGQERNPVVANFIAIARTVCRLPPG